MQYLTVHWIAEPSGIYYGRLKRVRAVDGTGAPRKWMHDSQGKTTSIVVDYLVSSCCSSAKSFHQGLLLTCKTGDYG